MSALNENNGRKAEKCQNRNDSECAVPSRVMSAFFLITILAHGVMFSHRSLRSIDSYYQNVVSQSEARAGDDTAKSMVSSILWNTNRNDGSPHSASSLRARERLPHWRMAVDCSVYSLDCFSRGQREIRYLPYPFPPSAPSDEMMSTEILREIPDEWAQRLQSYPTTNYSQVPAVSIQDEHNLYPPAIDDASYQHCLEFTGVKVGNTPTKSTLEQLDDMLASGRLTVEPDTNMLAFTISDSSYTQDMIHDMYQMMDHVVGFSEQHFVLLAIDIQTVEMACRHRYPVISWRESKQESLRDAVANTKIVLSLELVKRGIDFFFTEMDVWWIQSPKPSLMAFQAIPEDQAEENHLYFSGHQNNPGAANIGVYAAKSNNRTIAYFETCIDVLQQRPETHDQLAMQQVHDLYKFTLYNQPYKFGGNWGEKGPPPVPSIKLPFRAKYWGPHDIVADERPTPTSETMAIHTLCHMPLLNPHGKKMIAREIGAYYGFQTNPTPYFTVGRSNKPMVGASEVAGYYSRVGADHRRFVALDGPLRTSFYSTSPSDRYHDSRAFQWIATVLLAVAKISNRILILPHVFIADMDAGSYFSWNIMDYMKVNDFIDTRECNFLSNPKAWGPDDDWPFVSAATTALILDEGSNNATIYSQVTSRSHVVSKKAWQIDSLADSDMLEALAASLLVNDDVHKAELLLVNPDLMLKRGFLDRLGERWRRFGLGELTEVGRFEREVFQIYELLGWCWEEAKQHTVSKTSASHSCYAKGSTNKRHI